MVWDETWERVVEPMQNKNRNMTIGALQMSATTLVLPNREYKSECICVTDDAVLAKIGGAWVELRSEGWRKVVEAYKERERTSVALAACLLRSWRDNAMEVPDPDLLKLTEEFLEGAK